MKSFLVRFSDRISKDLLDLLATLCGQILNNSKGDQNPVRCPFGLMPLLTKTRCTNSFAIEGQYAREAKSPKVMFHPLSATSENAIEK
jgi:hypothetical protein